MRRVSSLLFLPMTAVLSGLNSTAQAQPPVEDPLGPDIFIAIRDNDTALVNSLLDKGVKTEAKNWLGINPLMWAAIRGNEPACAALLNHRSNAAFDTIYGSTLEGAEWSGNPRVVKLLLEHGAKFSQFRADKINALMTAAESGHTAVLRTLLASKIPSRPKINAADSTGMTALMHASWRGQTEAASMLLAAGADVNAADAAGRTAVMYAAMNGYAETVQLLLAKGVHVNAVNKGGDSALILTAKYCGDARTAMLLVKSGADIKLHDRQGRTAAEIAVKHGYSACAKAIDPNAGTTIPAKETELNEQANAAVLQSLPLIERATRKFSSQAACASCHHQGIGLITTGTAKIYGYKIDPELALSQQKVVTGQIDAGIDGLRKLVGHPEAYKFFPTIDMNEASPGFGITFCGLISQGAARNEGLEAMTTILARQQMPDGSWGFGLVRAPSQSSAFTTTAYVIRAIRAYLPETLSTERDERIKKAMDWLTATPAATTEDRAFRLLALKWAGAPQTEIEKAAADLLRTQHTDGGWAQFVGSNSTGAAYSRSDAYSTGESLYALAMSGSSKTTDPAYREGVKYLLRTQDDDGSWFVNKRAIPANTFLDTGFPHGESQYISYGATCFATMALMFAAAPVPHEAALLR